LGLVSLTDYERKTINKSMGKKIETEKKQTTWNHVVEKESGSRGAYMTFTDVTTKFGTGDYEGVLRAIGFEDLENKRHWKKDNRAKGLRPDMATAFANVARTKLTGDAGHQETKMTKEQVVLNKRWFESIFAPEVHAVLGIRKNPTKRKARKSVEQITNELVHYKGNPEELEKHITTSNEGLLEFIPEAQKGITVKALCKKFIADRESRLEALHKKA